VRKLNPDVKLYAQEPAFTPLDRAFLSLLDISVCDDGIATHITPHSFVFSPFVDWYILLPLFLKDKDPVLYVGNEILDDYGTFAQSEDKKAKLEECNELGKEFLKKRDVVKIREFEMHSHALNGMVVYWVKDGGEEDGEGDEEAGEERTAGKKQQNDIREQETEKKESEKETGNETEKETEKETEEIT
jgi:hypothetical protein